MRNNDVHLSDRELVLYSDGEILPEVASCVRAHLAACWSCRARSMELEGAIADFVQIHHSRIDARPPRVDGLRSSLKAQMAAAAVAGKSPRLRIVPMTFWQQAACAAVAVAIVVAVAWKMNAGLHGATNRADVAAVSALPNRTLTPGYTRPVKLSELCRMRQPNGPPDENVSLAQRVFRAYGLASSTSGSYELDYLITPDLGGADDARNLWPEPYGSTDWNAHVKDELEDRLHTMVCDGQIDLATAQKEIATNWIAAYKRYFHTETPLPNTGSGTVSQPKPDDPRHRRFDIVLAASRFGLVSIL